MKKGKKTLKEAQKGFGSLDRLKARQDGLRALGILRRIKKGIDSDVSIHEIYSNNLRYWLEGLESWVDRFAPASGRVSEATVDSLFDDGGE
jgi:hypothetical protein